MHKTSSPWLLLLLVGCALLYLGCGGVATEVTTIEWAEPVDGHWWDPLRWRDLATGAPRVPTESDRVHIATFVNQSFSVFVDPLGTGQIATVESLTVGSPDTDCCRQSGEAGCWAALALRGAKLTVLDWLLVNPFGVLRFTNSPLVAVDAPEGELSALVSPNTTVQGWVQGSARVQGNLDILPGSRATVATLYPNATVQHRWGNWFIEGNLTIYNRTEFLFDVPADNTTTEVAQIKATTLVVPTYDLPNVGSVNAPPGKDCTSLARNGITVFIYSQTNTGLQPSFFLYNSLVGTTSLFVAATAPPDTYGTTITSLRCAYFCPGDGTGGPERPGPACSSTSSHSFALLLGGVGGSQSCNCPPGTTGSACQNYYCPGIPECSGRGTCSSAFTPPRCVCPDGWVGFACEIPDCPGQPACSNNGLCISNTGSKPFCRCDANWTGPAGQPNDCSVPVCSNNCTSPDNGVCTAADSGVPHCQCLAGWALGPNLDCSVCRGGIECSGRGSCNRTSGQCSCAEGWRGADCSHTDCPGSPDCNHHGECVVVIGGTTDTVECQCAPGWTGPDCSQAACAVGSTPCSGHGKCVDVGLDPPRCVCSAGWTGPNCSVALTDCTAGMTPHCISCAGDASAQYCTSCEANWRGADCNTPYCLAANDFHVFPECAGHGSCSATGAGGSPTCQCRSGWLAGPLNDCVTPLCAAGDGEAECSGHGVCSTDLASPTCMCDAFFYGNSCSSYEPACPGYPAECTNSAQGTCVNGTCECADGWRGADCSVVRCPGVEENCNGRGECDSSVEPAECRCDDNWTGPDCATPICPGDCSGNGKCSGATNPPVCECMPYWGGPDCSRSEQRSGSDDSSATTYGAIGGALGGAVVLLMVGLVAAIALFKGIAAYKTYQINRSLKVGQVNFEQESLDPNAL